MADLPGGGGLPDLSGRVVINYDDLEKFLGQVNKTTAQVDSKMASVGKSFEAAGKKMTVMASLPIAAGIGFSVKAASDLGEAMNVTNITFEEGADEISAFSKTAAQGLGQSERAARAATAQFGGLLGNLGFASDETTKWSMDLTRLASDLGSAFNKEPEQAVLALGSALRGETEPIRAFNVMLDDTSVREKAVAMGLAETTAEVDNNAKAQARLALIMEQTVKYQGDFANTSEGLANKTRIAKAQLEDTAASMGQVFLPIAADAANQVNELAKTFGTLTETQQHAILGLGLAVAAAGPAALMFGKLALAIDGVRTRWEGMGTAGRRATGAVAVITAALTVAGTAWVQATAKAEKFIEVTNRDLNTASVESLRKSLANLNAEARSQDVQNGLSNLGDKLDPELRKLSSAAEEARRSLHTAETALYMTAEATGFTYDEVAKLAEKTGVDLTGSVSKSVSVLSDATRGMGTTNVATDKLADATETLSDTVADTEEKYDAFKSALDATFGSILDADEATVNLKDKTAELAEAYKEAGGKADANTEAGRRLISATSDAARAVYTEVEALTESGRISSATADQKQNLINRLLELQKQFPELRGKVQEYIAKINEIPDDTNTKVHLDTREALLKTDELIRRLNALPKLEGAVSTPVGPGSGAVIQRRASGGPIDAGRFYRVGEQGPELIYAATPGHVLNTPATRSIDQAGSSSSVQFGDIILQGVTDGPSVLSAIPRLTDALRAAVGAR